MSNFFKRGTNSDGTNKEDPFDALRRAGKDTLQGRVWAGWQRQQEIFEINQSASKQPPATPVQPVAGADANAQTEQPPPGGPEFTVPHNE